MEHTLGLYTRPGVMTSAGRHAALFGELPQDLAGLAAVAQGLLIHEAVASAYGVTLSDEGRETLHIRSLEGLLDRVVAADDRPFDVARTPDARTAGNCRHFTVLFVGMARAHGVPARARCGFADYFQAGWYGDHWVAEYWNADEQRWCLVDAQLDRFQRELFGIDFDPMDVPRDRFLVAGGAWAVCRTGEADPATFGLGPDSGFGDWWIAGNLIRDVAALNGTELLPWDVWGAMPWRDKPIDEDVVALLDRLATLTKRPDDNLDELLAMYRNDERLAVPPVVYSAVLDRDEAVL